MKNPHDDPRWDTWAALGLTEDEMRAEMEKTTRYVVFTSTGYRHYWAENSVHAREQHEDAFADDPDEKVTDIYPLGGGNA